MAPAQPQSTARKTALISAVVATFTVCLFILWYAANEILIVLIGILAAVVIDAGVRGLKHLCPPLPRIVSLMITVLLIGALGIGFLFWGGTTLLQQAGQFLHAMQDLFKRFNDFLNAGGNGLVPAGAVNIQDLLPSASFVFGSAKQVLSGALGAVTSLVAILFLGAFLAADPLAYKIGILSLIPKEKRARVNAVLEKVGDVMRGWLLGQCMTVTAVFFFTWPALLLIGMPYPTLLSLQAGLLAFIPTLGPVIAGIVIVLAGLSQNVTLALYGFGVYLFVQFLESNLMTPLIQRRTVRMPPALAVSAQLLFGALFGLLGVAFAVPLIAAAKMIIEELYVKDQLGGAWTGKS
jgi:predicted PurR-regulated permease PerM